RLGGVRAVVTGRHAVAVTGPDRDRTGRRTRSGNRGRGEQTQTVPCHLVRTATCGRPRPTRRGNRHGSTGRQGIRPGERRNVTAAAARSNRLRRTAAGRTPVGDSHGNRGSTSRGRTGRGTRGRRHAGHARHDQSRHVPGFRQLSHGVDRTGPHVGRPGGAGTAHPSRGGT